MQPNAKNIVLMRNGIRDRLKYLFVIGFNAIYAICDTMKELGVFCMGRRFNKHIEEKYQDMFVMRNAGANIKPIIAEIRKAVRENSVKEITVFTHNDCGAMKKVMGVLKEGKGAEEELASSLISQFKGVSFSSEDELENENTKLQLNALRREFPELKVNAQLLDTKTIEKNGKELGHVLIIASPGKPNYSRVFEIEGLDPLQCYIVQSQIDVSMPDIRLAVNDLKAKNVIIVTGDNDNPRDSKRYEGLLRIRLSDLNPVVKTVDIRK